MPKSTVPQNAIIQVHTTRQIRDALKILAIRQGRSVAEIIRDLIAKELAANGTGV